MFNSSRLVSKIIIISVSYEIAMQHIRRMNVLQAAQRLMNEILHVIVRQRLLRANDLVQVAVALGRDDVAKSQTTISSSACVCDDDDDNDCLLHEHVIKTVETCGTENIPNV